MPNPELLNAHPEIEPGLLRSMASEPAMVEVWSDAPDTANFHDCIRKLHQWHHTLELRAGSRISFPTAWLVSAGRPDTVLRDFGFVPDVSVVSSGLYTTGAPGWRVYIIVIAELPSVRSTVLLRLLGSARVRRMALRDLAALPEDAWERREEFPWLVRLSFEVPAEVVARLPADERDFIMETREWYEQFNARRLKEAKESWHARLCGKHLGRPLTDAEKATFTDRLDRLGEERVEEVILSSSSEALGIWLADPNAR
ncbi:MAG: hypothetical protein HUU21_25475 [Polyangiaceae bacterium]|nr:hypothetical protein [Polyangiaceae bacterium]